MAVTSNTYTVGGSGQAGPYSYSFPILADADVKVSVNGVVKTVTTHYTLDSANTRITFTSGNHPSTGDKVIVYRDTNEDPIKSVFSSGSTLRSNELNDNFNQLLYITQETDNQAMSTLGGVMQGNLGLGLKNNLYFEGDTDNAYETTVTVTDPTADRTITLPDTTGTVVTTGDTGTVTSTMITDGTIVNADVSANAEIAYSKLQVCPENRILVGNSSEIPTPVAMSGDATISSSGAVTIATGAVEHAMLAGDAVDGDNIGDDVVNSEHIVAGAVDLEHMSANSVDSDQYVDGSIDHVHLSADCVDGDNIADDAIGPEHIQANAVGTSEIADAELVTLAGMPSGTASILASSTELTSTTAELNLLDGKSIVTSVSGSSTDVQLPTAKAVNDQIVAIVQDIGGFYPIDDELKFPNTNPDPNDDAGTIVSIADAGGIVVNGSGVSTTGRTLGGATVTINGIDSSLNNTTIAAGKGMLVQTTSTLNTYTYHRLIVDEAGVANAQSLVSDFNDRYQVASSAPSNHPDGSALQDGDLWFDTSANVMKVYDLGNTSYATVTSTGDFKLLTVVPAGATSGTPDYTNTEFDLRDGSNAANVTSVGQLIVSVNGVLQKPNAGTSIAGSAEGFCLADSNTIKFATAPGSGASVYVTQIGAAVSVSVPATNSIVEAAIQSNVVSEEKLKISNAGTNNQFLQKQSGNSGGLTWADVPAGVGGANGVDFNDDVKARWGTDNDLEILHDDTKGTIKTTKGVVEVDGKDGITFRVDGSANPKIEFAGTKALFHAGYYAEFLGADASNGAYIQLHEDSGATSHKTTIKGANGMAADWTITLPTAAPTANGQALTATTGGVASWSNVSSTVADGCIYENDQTISNNYTIASGKGAHSVGPITVNATVTVNGNWVVS